jgi:HAMP domain-containing protein
VPDRALRVIFAFVLVLSGIKLVKTPGADTIILIGVVVGALVLAGWGLAALKTRRRVARRIPAHDPA